MVVFPCLANPDNWEYCWPPDWLIPYVQDAVDVLTVEPYAKEKAIINAVFRRSHGRHWVHAQCIHDRWADHFLLPDG